MPVDSETRWGAGNSGDNLPCRDGLCRFEGKARGTEADRLDHRQVTGSGPSEYPAAVVDDTRVDHCCERCEGGGTSAAGGLPQYRRRRDGLGQSVHSGRVRSGPGPTQQDPVTPMPVSFDLLGDESSDIVLVLHHSVTVRALQPRGEREPTGRECAVTEPDGGE